MTSDLKSILTPDLLNELANAHITLSPQEKVEDFGEAIKKALFSSEKGRVHEFWPRVWPALKAISKYGLDNLPNWFDILPPVESSEFPKQALGLQLLLDQSPRIFLKGIDQRWTSGFFDEVACGFALQLQDLPPHQRPSSWERWQDVGTFEYFIMLRLMYGAPIVHNEKKADFAIKFTDETRTLIEERYGVRDPIRDHPEKRWDLLGFPKLISSGGPSQSPCDTPTGGFWIQELMDVHKPPLDKFGRYPYRNWVMAREMTPEEDDWLEKAVIFKKPADEVVQKIKEDVANGVWSPLGSGGSGES